MIFNKIRHALHKIFKLIGYTRRFGFLKGANIFFSIAYMKGNTVILLPQIKYPVIIREKTTDVYTFEEIFLDECYNLSTNIKPKLIIDGGAYVGYAAIFFANKFPEAKIIAIEPEMSNYTMLKENTYYYRNIELIHSGIWCKKTWLKIKNAGWGEWGFEVEEADEIEHGSFQGITIDEILQKSGYNEIDILKLNIEGAEKEIFSHNYEGWLNKTNILIIELHDRIKQGCSEAFYSAIKHYNFSQEMRGAYIVLKKMT